ncbi:hypothetical protein ESA94_11925 [Lacibacter luteus]|uniref:Gliding motility lipoprotein GldB n=1 Tax=Lacibacter luteus TaxID=2508719 RepID=A0A4Q1CHL8_9BACT|nr:hypothetical protein [Lacibacter luteus]RXK59760.1 hypothetical protein ESA94_11925 [Lacibacter luteus]
MKKLIPILLLISIAACNSGNNAPDVSHIKLSLKTERFEQDFFAIDSNNAKTGVFKLEEKYPVFLPLFVNHVLGLGPVNDTNELAFEGSKRFLNLNQVVYKESQKLYKDFSSTTKELENGFRYVKYYFPDYKVPTIITTVGPMDALAPMSNNEPSPNYMGEDFLAIGLQFYLGKDFSIYNDPGYISSVAPQYRSARFSKEYIAGDVFKLVIDDLYPDSSSRYPLIERFIEKGKRLYLLQQFLPTTNDTLLIGYTGKQLEWCKENERSMYNFFIQQNLLFEIDPALTQNFTTDGPTTQGMPEQSPGNIGAYLGWEIVKAYMEKKPSVTVAQLMRTPNKTIFNESGYKPH